MRKYHQQIHGVDCAIGMIRAELNEQGIADNTVIIVTSDNGYNCGSHGFGGKVLPYEEGSRAPLIIYDPRRKKAVKGSRHPGVTGNIDIMPTILDLVALPIPDDVDGKSLRPLLSNPGGRIRNAMAIMNVWGSVPTHELSVVTEDYKYIYWFFAAAGMKATEELYHLRNDRYEMNNLANHPGRQTVLSEMRLWYDLEIERWKKNCIQRNGYPEWGTLLDRSMPWEAKEGLIPTRLTRGRGDYISGDPQRSRH
jgi:arylsulfatase A-like enzyme